MDFSPSRRCGSPKAGRRPATPGREPDPGLRRGWDRGVNNPDWSKGGRISLESGLAGDYLCGMKRAWCWLGIAALLWSAVAAPAATGRVLKVLPEFLDREGRTSLSPSLFERDAYQAVLRAHPEQRSGLRYYVQWKTKGGVWEPLTLRIELRGRAEGNLPSQLILEEALVNKHTLFTRWTGVTLSKDQYQRLGAVTAWRVTLWEGSTLLAEQRSFLW
jgi:hypothetical protein